MDAPGALHHVIARGIERREIFRDKSDYQDYLSRLEVIIDKCNLQLYAWALIPNHFHLLIRTGLTSLSSAMKKLMTGYAVNFNKRHRRHGYLFQNRYKSILCEEESYLLELTRYIHLNPYRAGLVKSLEELDRCPWSGHSALMGKIERSWQNSEEILVRFGKEIKKARDSYRNFIKEGIAQGKRPELTGGGLIRSAGGWSEVLALRRHKEGMVSDSRILGNGKFVEAVLKEAEEREAETLRLKNKKIGLKDLCKEVAKVHRIEITELTSGSCRRVILKAREDMAQLAVKKLGMSGAEVARHLGVTTSCINRVINKKEISLVAETILDKWKN
ncbi:MAG: transposase [Pseudomonadota bacterium]